MCRVRSNCAKVEEPLAVNGYRLLQGSSGMYWRRFIEADLSRERFFRRV